VVGASFLLPRAFVAREHLRMPTRRFIVTPREADFVLCRDGESWEVRFKSIRDAIRHATAQPNSEGSILVVLNDKGTASIELTI
jgi:hypothetical protein